MTTTKPKTDAAESARRILCSLIDRAQDEIWKPNPGYRSLAEQMRQSAELILAELAEAEVNSR